MPLTARTRALVSPLYDSANPRKMLREIGLGGLSLQAKLAEPRPGVQKRRTGLPDEVNEVIVYLIIQFVGLREPAFVVMASIEPGRDYRVK